MCLRHRVGESPICCQGVAQKDRDKNFNIRSEWLKRVAPRGPFVTTFRLQVRKKTHRKLKNPNLGGGGVPESIRDPEELNSS